MALSVFIHAWPRNSLKQKNVFIKIILKEGFATLTDINEYEHEYLCKQYIQEKYFSN